MARVTLTNGHVAVSCTTTLVGIFDEATSEGLAVATVEVTDDILMHFAAYVHEGILPDDVSVLKELYIFSANIRCGPLRDAIEIRLLPTFDASTTIEASESLAAPQFNPMLDTDEYVGGAWRQRYAPKWEERDIISSFHRVPPIPSALYSVRQQLSQSSSLPDPFGVTQRRDFVS